MKVMYDVFVIIFHNTMLIKYGDNVKGHTKHKLR